MQTQNDEPDEQSGEDRPDKRYFKRLAAIYVVLLVGWWIFMWSDGSRVARPWEGPWRAQVVDAETGQPLEGVVVLAWWSKSVSLLAHGGTKYVTSQEVVTGPDGRFEIDSEWLGVSLIPFFTAVYGPSWKVFKPGYGQWQFQGYDEEYRQQTDRYKAQKWLERQREQFEEEGAYRNRSCKRRSG